MAEDAQAEFQKGDGDADDKYSSQLHVNVARMMVKIKVSNRNGNDSDDPTVYVAVGNEDWVEQQYIPFESDWYAPYCLAQELMSRKYQTTVPELHDGKPTGNMVAKQMDHYLVQFLLA